MTRNERRKAAQARLKAKEERFLARIEAARQQAVHETVRLNGLNPPPRNFYPASNMASFSGVSHRGYVCKATGAMPRGRALALKAKGSY